MTSKYRKWVWSLIEHYYFVRDESGYRSHCTYCGKKTVGGHKNACKKHKFKKFVRNVLYRILSLVFIEGQREIAGMHYCYLVSVRGFKPFYVWGRIPWQQFKNHPWFFKPVIQASKGG